MSMLKAVNILVALLCLAACAPNYSESAADFAKGVSDVKDSSATISANYNGTQVLYYSVKRRLNKDTPLVPDVCKTMETYSDCYLTGKTEQAREEKADQLVSASVAIGNTFVPALGDNVKDVNPAGIPPACLDYIASTLTASVSSTASAAPAAAPKKPLTEADLLSALDNYAKGLAAITNKADSDAYKSAASKLSGSVGALAGTLGAAAGGVGAAAGPIIKAVIDIGTHINLAHLESHRYEALKVAVLSACIPVHNLAYAEGIILGAKRQITSDRNRRLLNDLSTPSIYNRDRAENDVAIDQASANLRALGPNAAPTAVKIAEIHNQLVEAVLSGKGQTDALIQNIGDFATEARALKDAIENQKASGNASAGGTSGT